MPIEIDRYVSLFDFLIVGVLIWGIYKGYMQGFIVQTIALFVLLAGVYIGVKLSSWFYDIIIANSKVELPNLQVVTFAILFGFIGFASNYVALIVQKQVMSLPKPITTRILGAFFSAVKYMFIISIVLIFVNNLNVNFKIVPSLEKSKTTLYNPFLNFAPTILPKLKSMIKEPRLMEIPEIDVTDVEE